MSYEAFKTEYIALFKRMMSYSCDQAGSVICAGEMADMADAHPIWAEKVESENG